MDLNHNRHFNPRSHEGSDLFALELLGIYLRISIHAPTRGATIGTGMFTHPCPDFNPRSHEGSDESASGHDTDYKYFNPRSHEGSDYFLFVEYVNSKTISIHAPTRGATAVERNGGTLKIFQSTLPLGERLQH